MKRVSCMPKRRGGSLFLAVMTALMAGAQFPAAAIGIPSTRNYVGAQNYSAIRWGGRTYSVQTPTASSSPAVQTGAVTQSPPAPASAGLTYPAAYVSNAGSAWNTPITSGASFGYVAGLNSLSIGLDSWLGSAWSIPFYQASPTAAQNPAGLQQLLFNPYAWWNVYTGAWRRFGNSPSVEQQILSLSTTQFPLYQNKLTGNSFSTTSAASWVLPVSYNGMTNPTGQFYFSPAMQPASGPDGHMAVLQPNGKIVETYATIVLSTGQVVALSYVVSDPASLADGWQNGQTASMLPIYAGQISDEELNNGAINHAMAIAVPPSILKPAISYPAYAFDRDATTNGSPYRGVLPMGSRLALPPTVSIASLGLATAEGKAIATAAQKYGFIIVDRGGGGGTIRVRANPSQPNAAVRTYGWPLQSDLNKIIANLKSIN
jgi:hypothetical protein